MVALSPAPPANSQPMSASSAGAVRLVAIAKDEGAYLAQWIFHHLHFGFDEIEVLINQTSDRSVPLLQALGATEGVHWRCVDHLLSANDKLPFQKLAYAEAYARATQDGCSHVAFLDIDELWTPTDFSSPIQSFLSSDSADVLLTPWVVPEQDPVLFGTAFEGELRLYRNRHVKCISRCGLALTDMGVHAVSGPKISLTMIDGQQAPAWDGQRIDWPQPEGQLGAAFVLHRMWRSPLEYVSSLAQGLRQAQRHGQTTESLKINRKGYGKAAPTEDPIVFKPPSSLTRSYLADYAEFVHSHQLTGLIQENQRFVIERCSRAIRLLQQRQMSEPKLVSTLLQRLDEPYILEQSDAWLAQRLELDAP